MMKIILDTNIIIEGKWFEDIPWFTIIDAEVKEVLIPEIVVSELDKKKFDPRTKGRVRNRSKTLFDLLDSEFSEKLKCPVRLLQSSFSASMFKEGLSVDHADDTIINAALVYREQLKDNDEVLLITFDNLLVLKTKKRPIKSMKLGDEFIADLKDEKDKKIDRLSAELKTAKSKEPKLDIVFKNNQKKIDVEFTYSKEIKDSADAEILKMSLREKCPELFPPNDLDPDNPLEAAVIFANRHFPTPKESYEKYSKERDCYLKEVDQYVIDVVKYEELHSRSFEFELKIRNTGTYPASKVSVYMHFPDGFKLIDMSLDEDEIDEIENYPCSPRIPELEKNNLQALLSGENLFPHNHLVLNRPSMYSFEKDLPRPTIKRTNSYDFDFELDEDLMHHKDFSLGKFKIFYDTPFSIKSFSVDCSIHCKEFSAPLEHQLHFVVNK